MASQRELAEQLCDAALDLKPAEREAFLDRACSGDPGLRQDVEALLAADAEAGSFLNHPVLQGSTVDSTTQSTIVIGPYHLLELIGEGGMGEVWLAEQKQPVRRRVAIKLIKAGMDTREVVARFESERQALALMDHPAIAKVFDAGSTSEGRPYFVMEYVAGIPITDYCDKHKLTIRQRMELFIHVCEGVQHAHQKAVIHRDLKPSNILVSEVDGKPIPHIIDFGVAKATSQKLTAETMYTRIGTMVGTIGYMSPEQADPIREDIDTRTDIYSLGALLYELLTGALPLDFKKLAYEEVLRRLRDEDAPRPSTKVTTLGEGSILAAKNRGADPPRLARQLRGDPDAIVLKALEKDRARRYASASDLAADIGRYLRNEPVTVHPPSIAYRVRNYIRRHRLGVAGLGIAVPLLLLLCIGTLLFMRFKDRQSHDVRPTAQRDLRALRLTTLSGHEVSPAFSPDGSQVAFAWDGGNGSASNPFNLYVKVIGSESTEPLTHEPADWIVPAWSPDGTTIALARQGGQEPGLFSVPARGGAERKLADAVFDYPQSMSLSWSSDGHQLLYYSAEGLRILIPETGEVRPVNTPDCGAIAPAFSPDGKWIAFVCETSQVFYVDLLPIKGGSSRHLVKGDYGAIAWSADSQRIIFQSFGSRLSEIDINGEGLHDLAFAQDEASQPAIARQGGRLAFTKGTDKGEIWKLDAHTGLARGAFAPATVEQMAPDISPDGKRIAFESDRSGSHEVWVANLDGSDAVQLSNFHERLTGTPRWSPDGRRVVFDSRVGGKAGIYLVDPATALPRQIPTGNLPASVPSWSPDGKWIYFTSPGGSVVDTGPLYRVAPEGGHPERVIETLGYNVKGSKDGKFLYFFAGSSSMDGEIHVLDLASGREQPLPGMPKVLYPTDWTLGSKGIFFVDWSQKPSIDFFDFSSQRVTQKILLDKQPSVWGGLALSADETWLAYSQLNQSGSDLMLVEGFR